MKITNIFSFAKKSTVCRKMLIKNSPWIWFLKIYTFTSYDSMERGWDFLYYVSKIQKFLKPDTENLFLLA